MKTLITREMLITEIAKRCDYFKQDVRRVFNEFDDLVEEYLSTIDENNEEISIQVVRGLKFSGKLVPERPRRDPRTNKPIICSPTVKLNGKVSETIKEVVQKAYEDKKDE
jgi:nucleoid DNA-binding protein